jgi:hypothetical protein
MTTESEFTVAALFYGNYPHLAERLLSSLHTPATKPHNYQLRLGLNAISPKTQQIIDKYIALREKKNLITHVFAGDNIWKYPRMHQMIHDIVVNTPYFVWFDDDSCIAPKASSNWFGRLHKFMQTTDMAGKLYYKLLKGNQAHVYMKEPWWNGKYIEPKRKVIFITGGFWCIKSEILLKHDWPPEQCTHFGGDVALGELIRQWDYKQSNYEKDVFINANKYGKASTAPRRGWHRGRMYGVK